MPSKTKKQARAMAAAAHGNSKIGIPADVGKEYHKHDRKSGLISRAMRGKKRKG